jgi:HEPN domain-containing protein
VLRYDTETLEWIEFAEHDYLTSKTLLTVHRIPNEIVAYHCQQTAEKYLKAILVQNDLAVPFIHDLLKLNREAQKVLPSLKELEKTCELLTPFGTATRYPGSTMIIGPEHIPSVVAWADSIRHDIRVHFNLST